MKHLSPALLVAIALLPVYLWSSGGLQPSHYLLAVYCGAFLVARGYGLGTADEVLIALLIIVLAREGYEAIVGNSLKSLLPVAHLVFGIMVLNVMRRAMSSDRLRDIALVGVLISATIAVVGVFYTGYAPIVSASTERAAGTFNNPNQLGYFAICLFSIAFLYRLRFQLAFPQLVYLVLCSFFLAVASLSKAAMIGVAIPLLFVGFAGKHSLKSMISGSLIFAIVCMGFYWAYSSGSFDDYSFAQRLQGIGSHSDDSLQGRGYSLFLDGTVLTFFAGLGQVEAVRRNFDHEVHSTVFSFFVNYGVVGGGIFLSFIVLWVRRVWSTLGGAGILLVVSPVLLYGLTHNGSRFAMFWVLVALSFVSVRSEKGHARP